MVRVVFKDFKDSALKFDSQASIAFVVTKDELWVKTGTRAKQLCYKEEATISGVADGKTVSVCLEHGAVQKGADARISSNGIENTMTMIIDEDKKVVAFEVQHILRTPATDTEPEKVQELGTSRRGPFKWETGFSATQTTGLPTGISAEVRAEAEKKNSLDTVSSKALAEVFEMLGVVKQPIFITAEEEIDGTKFPSKAFISGQAYGEMAIPAFKRGVKVSYDLAAPVGKLLAKDTGNAECLARVDENKVRIFTVQTDSFYVSGAVEKITPSSLSVVNLMTVAGLDYSAFTFTCPKVLVANIVEGKHTLKLVGNNLFVGEDTITVGDLSVSDDVGNEIQTVLTKGVEVDFSQMRKFLSSEDRVAFAIAKFVQDGKDLGYVLRIGVPAGENNKPCWFLPATVAGR